MDASLITFAQQLVGDIAVPELAKGYGALVEQLRQNEALKRMAQEKGIDAALANSGDLATLQKKNKELVTSAEKIAEGWMRDKVKAHFPDHAIVGEEHGYTPGSATRWVFDPVDGTSAMLRTAMADAFELPLAQPTPAFGITVAMMEGDEATLGIVTELQSHNGTLVATSHWLGVKGQPTLHNGAAIHLPTAPARLAEATLACTVPQVMFKTKESWGGFQALQEATGKACVTDQNCIGFMRLLHENGGIDVVYEADLAYHDAAALVPILQGAGITVSDSKGNRLQFPESAIGEEFSILTAQPALHALALKCVQTGVAADKNRFADSGLAQHGYAQKFPVAS